VLPSNSQLSYTRQKTLLLPSQLQQFIMQALSSATGLATQRKPSLVSAVRSMIKELLEELLLIFLKFKAWLTPGTADDKVSLGSVRDTASSCQLSSRSWTHPVANCDRAGWQSMLTFSRCPLHHDLWYVIAHQLLPL
jgi:hypothetical protein